jgi:hypothetical protein
VIVAPWLYGGTTAWSIEITNGMLGVALAFWIASLLVDRRWPALPRTLVIVTAFILIQGWWMVLNAHAIFDSGFRLFLPLAPIAPGLAGSSDYVLSFAAMVRTTLLVGSIVLVADMMPSPRWLLRLWFTVAIAGGSIALLGLVQKATGATMVFWRPPVWPPIGTFFATFVYHANAGAYLNLVLPPVAGLTCWVVVRHQHRVARALLAGIAMVVLLAIASNTSRMSQAVGALVVIALLATVVRPLILRALHGERRTLFIALTIAALATFAVAQASRLHEPLTRWRAIAKQLPIDERWVADCVALRASGDAGVFGFGPGVFRAVFPHYQQAFAGGLHGTWRFLHEDYLQTVLEWGWLGALAFGALFFGGLGIGLRNYLTAEGWASRQRILLLCAILALAGVALHALVDFPLQILSIQLLAATYLGICWGSGGWRAEVGDRRSEVRDRKSEGGGRT